MLTEIFRFVISLSLLGSILAAGIVLIKLLFRRKLSANWHYCIWFVLLLRLLIPLTPATPFSVFDLIPYHQQNGGPTQISMPGSAGAASGTVTQTHGNPVQITPEPLVGKENLQQSPVMPAKPAWFNWQNAARAWVFGMMAISCYILLVNGLLLFKIRTLPVCYTAEIMSILEECKAKLKVQARVSVVYDDSLKSPALFGLFRPRIIISPELIKKLSPEELRYIFLHELSHLKRGDLPVNGLALVIQVVYWFNPLIWLALRQMKQDCEMACDATALAVLKAEDHKQYGQTIISLLQMLSEPHWAPGTLSFVSKFNIRRIIMISKFKKTALTWTVAALALTLAAGCASLNNPINNVINPDNQIGSSQNQDTPATTGQQKDTASQQNTNSGTPTADAPAAASNSIVYKNAQYGFNFTLPAGWQGYSVITGKWVGNDIASGKVSETGPQLSIRHPQWTAQNPRQDIPIMVFTLGQWNLLQQGKFHIGAAPVGPGELGRNGSYVFALPARYNYAFPTGYKEVEQILAGHPLKATGKPVTMPPAPSNAGSIVYKNTQYGFNFPLPAGWQGYSVITGKWDGNDVNSGKVTETGPMLSLRHPQWTAQNPRQDIPIMVFSLVQWNSLQQEKFHIGAAPIGPSELGRNSSYVFALPARYNYAFPTGYEEVERILANHPLQAI